jgi:prepilin-type N-terminal cleavage/methylation domain-containing protein
MQKILQKFQKNKYGEISRGFTLIELIIYIALFSILIGGVITCTYNLFESSGHNETQAMLVEEGNFLLGKTSWLMSGIQTINTPTANTSGNTLSVTKTDPSVGNPVVMSMSGNNITLQRGATTAQILNNTNVWLSNVSFAHTIQSGQGLVPESIIATFTLNTRTPDGVVVSHVFSETYYIEK